jgi:hypothetical protein
VNTAVSMAMHVSSLSLSLWVYNDSCSALSLSMLCIVCGSLHGSASFLTMCVYIMITMIPCLYKCLVVNATVSLVIQ